MLNYDNLNDMEFEALCNDIMSRRLGIPLRRFGPGKDGGVDLTDDAAKKNIVVQVKHYRSSPTDQLVRSLKNELPKVKKLQPKKYYICCSRELTAKNISELYQHFGAYMESSWNIVTLTEIDDLLHQDAYRDILKRHFKLWLDSTGILEELLNDEIFVDCEALLSDVDELQRLFVRTSAFDRALKVLETNQPLCIIGDPGVGKSITSKMLVLHYAAQGYRVRYTTDVSDLKSLKKALRDDAATKEVILLDDCFGQAYFEMKTSQSSELVALIKYVKLHPAKVLILNSRVTIFQEARERQQELVRCMDRKEFRVHILDMNNLSGEERAKILYNHLVFSGIPDDYFENIRIDRRYRSIISHRNYNPRIIEFVCNSNRYSKIPSAQFFEYIMKQLDNPQEIWANEYDDRLQPADRILLQTIYSLTTTTVNADLVRSCYERRIAGIPTIDKTLDQYSRSLNRLNEGFIKIIDNRGSQELSMQNPSVNDFLDSRLREGTLERNELIQSICAIGQLRLIPNTELLPYTANLLRTQAIETFIFQKSEDKYAFIGHCIICSMLQLKQYQPAFWEYLESYRHAQLTFMPLPSQQTFRDRLLLPEIWEFYELKSFYEKNDRLYDLLSSWSLQDAIPFIAKCDSLFHGSKRIHYTQQVDRYLKESIDEYCEVEADWYDVDVHEAIEETIDYTPDGNIPDIEGAAEYIKEFVAESAVDDLQDLFGNLPQHFSHLIENIDTDSISVSGADSLVESYLIDPPDEYEPVGREYHSDYSPIDAIFER